METPIIAETGTRGEGRITRGIKLYNERGAEIRDIGDGFYLVPSCSEPRSYVVDIERETCECPDHEIKGRTCKHIVAVTLLLAKGPGAIRYGLEADLRDGDERYTVVAVRGSSRLELGVYGSYDSAGRRVRELRAESEAK